MRYQGGNSWYSYVQRVRIASNTLLGLSVLPIGLYWAHHETKNVLGLDRIWAYRFVSVLRLIRKS